MQGRANTFFQKKNTKIPPRRNVPTLNRIRKIVSSEPGKEIEKGGISSCHENGTKKTFWVPIRNWTSDLRIPRSDALPQSRRDSVLSKAYYKVHIWHASCILLRSVMSIASCFVNWIRKMVTFVWVRETFQGVGKGITSISLFASGGLLTMRKSRLIFDISCIYRFFQEISTEIKQ